MKLFTILGTFLASANAAAISSSARTTTNMEHRAAPEVTFDPQLTFVSASPVTNLLRRVAFQPAARDEYCGEFTPLATSDAAKPLASDCQAIADAARGMTSGYYVVTPADYAASEWVTVSRAGTCAYAVRLKPESRGKNMWVGTNDVRFQIDTTVRRSKDGRAGFMGNVDCFNGNGGVLAAWKLAYAG